MGLPVYLKSKISRLKNTASWLEDAGFEADFIAIAEMMNEMQLLHKHDVGRSRWYWLLIAKTEPLVKDGQVPIYWTKKNAEKDAETYGGTIVKVECNW